MRKKYYEDAKENVAFERCVDVITSLIVKYGPSIQRKWLYEDMVKSILVECFWEKMTIKRYRDYYKFQKQLMKEKCAI